MAAEDLIKRAREHLATLNDRDWSRYRSGFGDDSVLDEEATGRQLIGPDEIVNLSKSWIEAFPDLKATEVSIHASGDTVIVELLWEGTHKGMLSSPMGSIPPSGKHAKVPAVQVTRFEGGKVAESRHYFDLMTLMRQIGAMPGAQPAAP